LKVAAEAHNVNASPVNIIYSSDSLPELHNIGSLESRHFVAPSPKNTQTIA
jgi:hypothetical protein